MGCVQSSSGVYIIPVSDLTSDFTIPKHVEEFQKNHPEAIQVVCVGYWPDKKSHIFAMYKNSTPGIYRYSAKTSISLSGW